MTNQVMNITSASNQFEVTSDSNYVINFTVDATLFIRIVSANMVNVNVNINDNIKAHIIYWNEEADNIRINENYQLFPNSYLSITYGELAKGDVVRKVNSSLNLASELLIQSASITSSKKHQTFYTNHVAKHSVSNVNNYSIVNEGGVYYLDVIGKIQKGSSGAKAHQDSKLLTISDNQSTTVLPQLLIDENDVEASHAATVGQIDEEQLYYMQSRGLSEVEAMTLVMSGYLMPIARAIEDEAMQKQIIELIDKRVVEICQKA